MALRVFAVRHATIGASQIFPDDEVQGAEVQGAEVRVVELQDLQVFSKIFLL